MIITLCASVDFTPTIITIADALETRGCKVNIPFFTNKIRNGDMTFDDYKTARQNNDGSDIRLRDAQSIDFIKRYWDYITGSDAVLVVNLTKNGIPNYIGGNTLIEMGFAYGHGKPLFCTIRCPNDPNASTTSTKLCA